MCGIVAYKGNEPKTFKEIINLANRNKHRGEDGIGIIYEEDGQIKHLKNLYSLTELVSGELDKDTYSKPKRVGSFEYRIEDNEAYEKNQRAFKKYVDKINKKSSNFIYLHHRKGTIGNISLENQHPVKVGNNLYIHNGTAYLSDTIRRYVEVMEGVIFNTETDTEIIAYIYQKYKDYFDGDCEKAYNELTKIFDSGFGILIEITPEGNVTVIKDDCRKLWYYQLGESYLMTSEPNPYINGYTDIGYLPTGIIDMNKPYIVSIRDTYESALNAWIENGQNYNESKCDKCNTEGKIVKSSYLCGEHPVKNTQGTYACFECICLAGHKENTKSNTTDIKKLVNDKIEKFGIYLGSIKDDMRPMVMEIANT